MARVVSRPLDRLKLEDMAGLKHRGLFIIVFAALLVGCAAGDLRFAMGSPAGFWVGLWHGMISFITLVIGIFSDTVQVYEINNTGGWYDFGFLLGVTMIWGGGHRARQHYRWRHRKDKEWEEVGKKIEVKVKRMIEDWAETEPDEDWHVVEAKAEAKLKRRLREWAEEP